MMLPPDGRFARHEIPQADFLFPYVASGVTTVQSLAATSEEVEHSASRSRRASCSVRG